MYNSSFQESNLTTILDENLQWYVICQGYFGSIIITITTTIFLVVGTPIHCWSFWVFIHRNIKPSTVFLLNLTMVDLFYCIHCLVDLIISKYTTVSGYQIGLFLIGLHWTVRPLLQICLCLEHYMAVIHPVAFLRYNSIQYRIALATASWLIGLSNSFRLIFIGILFFPDEIFFMFFCISVMLISFCCTSVLCALKRPGPGDRNKDRPSKTDRGRAVESQQKRKAFRIISHILSSILVCYLPLVIAYFMRVAQIDEHLFACSAFPVILSTTRIVLLFSPLLRMYNEGHQKPITCLLKLIENMKGK